MRRREGGKPNFRDLSLNLDPTTADTIIFDRIRYRLGFLNPQLQSSPYLTLASLCQAHSIDEVTDKAAMATYNQAQRLNDDVSDQEEEAMANEYREQVQYGDDDMLELDRTNSMGGGMPDMQAQLLAAATPLEYQATLETKVTSYDNYCNLFHYILNSDGPVDLEPPSVR